MRYAMRYYVPKNREEYVSRIHALRPTMHVSTRTPKRTLQRVWIELLYDYDNRTTWDYMRELERRYV